MIAPPPKDAGKRTTTMKIGNYRHKKILEMLYQRESVSADELAAEFGVSKITIRRDLDLLAGENLLERTRGGAVLASCLRLEELFDQKDHLSKREKSLIGRYAASLVGENETVFVNAGSTTLEVVRHLRGKKARVVTNNAACLGLDLEQELILLGGDYRAPSKSLVGDLTILALRGIFSSVTVLGINGVSIKKGCTSAVHQETAVNRAMIENSNGKVIVVADHTKMNCVSSFLTCPLKRIDMIVTDWMAPLAFCREIEEQGVCVVRVEDREQTAS
ncbi:MAG: DeoR/GlpR family DNA-binding transcription regulator [Candidatus Accumulibacter sp.]|jgi:DeoR family fructose operon transcriptional repressor|nr:DeoR/GlpR family DNA-binding transcription regulator [Accumulibacter sp.]